MRVFLRAFLSSTRRPSLYGYLELKDKYNCLFERRGLSWTSLLKIPASKRGDDEHCRPIGVDSAKLGQHSVFVLQPHIAAYSQPLPNVTTPQLQLAESVALVDCLPGWQVCGKMILRTSYMLVLDIFRLRAQTKQAKLQVALAEIPYLKANLKSEIPSFNRQGGGFHAVGGPGETPLELMLRRFKIREQKIKKSLDLLRKRRTEQREVRKKSNLPVVAVVGYTNAGKTTLIKALSKSKKLEPKNHLFATLDVTTHAAVTNGSMRYLLVDTVGFLSNLPHSLIGAFNATMEDMLQADLIIHVCDVSHPDHEHQRLNVYKVLSDLLLPKNILETIIEVHNKVDLVTDQECTSRLGSTDSGHHRSKTSIKHKEGVINTKPSSICTISATRGIGLNSLDELLHSRLVEVTGGQSIRVRVPADGDHLDWLNEYAAVDGFENDGDYHFVIDCTISEAMWNKFKSRYHAYRVV